MKTTRFYLDHEFIAGFRKPLFGKARHFIDLISIGIVDDAGREYYAISKEFDLDYAWKDEWVRENVLKALHAELCQKESTFAKTYFSSLFSSFSKRSLKNLLRWHGKTDKQIANEIRGFVYGPAVAEGEGLDGVDADIEWWLKENKIEFYAYYADYDWVLFCSLFGRMIDLPDGFPQFCFDLKQTMEDSGLDTEWKRKACPDPMREHHALVDARWNQKLHRAIRIQSQSMKVGMAKGEGSRSSGNIRID